MSWKNKYEFIYFGCLINNKNNKKIEIVDFIINYYKY